MNLNRNNPVPLWAALAIGAAVLSSMFRMMQSQLPATELGVTLNPRNRPSISSSTLSPSATSIAVAIPTTTSMPAALAQVDISDWRTYRNTRYEFEFRYPANWAVSTPGEGEATLASSRDSVLTVAPQLGEEGMSLEIYRFGSPEIGTYFQSARSLKDYLSLLTASSSSKSIITFLKMEVIGEKQATWLKICSVTHKVDCVLQAYFENGGVIYKVVKTQLAKDLTFDRVLSTFRFVSVGQ